MTSHYSNLQKFKKQRAKNKNAEKAFSIAPLVKTLKDTSLFLAVKVTK